MTSKNLDFTQCHQIGTIRETNGQLLLVFFYGLLCTEYEKPGAWFGQIAASQSNTKKCALHLQLDCGNAGAAA